MTVYSATTGVQEELRVWVWDRVWGFKDLGKGLGLSLKLIQHYYEKEYTAEDDHDAEHSTR